MPPGGSTAEKNLIPEPQQESPDETEKLLPAENAVNFGAPGSNENYNPYTEESSGDNNLPDETAPQYPEESTEGQNTVPAQQTQLSDQQQAEAALSMESNKQRQLQQVQRQRTGLENQLSALQKDLTSFKDTKQRGFFKIFEPKINLLINSLISEMQKGANKLTDEAKVGYYTGLIITATSLIGLLTSLKFLAASFDAFFSWLKKALPSCFTCVGCILMLLLLPFYVAFFAAIFMLGTIPLLKGKQTKNIGELIVKLKKQRDAWQAELSKTKNKVILQKQIKELRKREQTMMDRRR